MTDKNMTVAPGEVARNDGELGSKRTPNGQKKPQLGAIWPWQQRSSRSEGPPITPPAMARTRRRPRLPGYASEIAYSMACSSVIARP